MKRKSLVALVVWLWAVVAFAAPPQRIISVSPDPTEILSAFGVLDRVVGVSDYCTYPPEVNKLPRVGGWVNPSLERIVGLKPDLIVLTASQSSLFGQHLQQLGIRTLVVPTRTIADAYTSMKLIGDAVGKEREAQPLIDRTRASLEAIRNRARNAPRPSVLIAVERSPGSLRDLYIATPGSYLAELVELAGGRVVGAATATGYSKISKERLITMNADVVIEMKMTTQASSLAQARAEWNELPELNAVRSGKVIELNEDYLNHCSQRIVESADLLLRTIHPELASTQPKGAR